jgi:hypothetical protein
MKKKILLSSVAVIVLCLCIVAGSTFALFTTETTVNIAVTAGNLDITASIKEGKVFTQSAGDPTEFARDGSFANGGKATVNPQDPSKLSILGMTPGDAIKFNVEVVNDSNIAIQYRVVWKSNESDTTVDLADALKVTVQVNGSEQLNMTDRVSDYYSVPAGGAITTFTVTLEFPNADNNDTYKGAMADLTFMVEAVQGNGVDSNGNLING